jgi:anti-anti-sigma factor
MSLTPPLIVSLDGELDIAQRDALDWKLKPAQFADPVILDLSNVSYIDSTALSAFVRLRKARIDKGYDPEVLVVANMNVRKVLALTQLDSLWEIYDTLDEALRAAENLPDLPA